MSLSVIEYTNVNQKSSKKNSEVIYIFSKKCKCIEYNFETNNEFSTIKRFCN